MASDSLSFAHRLKAFLGLAYLPDGKPHKAGPSRYSGSFALSRRLDEDIDALTQRVIELEEQLRQSK